MGAEIIGATAAAIAAVIGAFVSLLGVTRGWKEQERQARKGEIERLEKALETRDLWIEDLRTSLEELERVYRRERTSWRKERAELQTEVDALRGELEAMRRTVDGGQEV